MHSIRLRIHSIDKKNIWTKHSRKLKTQFTIISYDRIINSISYKKIPFIRQLMKISFRKTLREDFVRTKSPQPTTHRTRETFSPTIKPRIPRHPRHFQPSTSHFPRRPKGHVWSHQRSTSAIQSHNETVAFVTVTSRARAAYLWQIRRNVAHKNVSRNWGPLTNRPGFPVLWYQRRSGGMWELEYGIKSHREWMEVIYWPKRT